LRIFIANNFPNPQLIQFLWNKRVVHVCLCLLLKKGNGDVLDYVT
jgi:hypothetical protein